MRGEDVFREVYDRVQPGSPPHARGRRHGMLDLKNNLRLTPACAGKTGRVWAPRRRNQAHPRMRGEDVWAAYSASPGEGSPPHARGRLIVVIPGTVRVRLTPACAGKTEASAASTAASRAHPRMRGEDDDKAPAAGMMNGSPPHARGRRVQARRGNHFLRLTPACAGKTVDSESPWSFAKAHPRMRGEDSPTSRRNLIARGSPPHARGRRLDFPENPTKLFSSLPIFLSSQPSPLKRFLCRVLGVRLTLWKQH